MRTPYSHSKPHLSLKNWANTSCPAAIRYDDNFHFELIVAIAKSRSFIIETSRGVYRLRNPYQLKNSLVGRYLFSYILHCGEMQDESGKGVSCVNPPPLNSPLETFFNLHSRTKISDLALLNDEDKI